MLDAIEKLHDRGYIHRDIKPSNFVMGKAKSRNQVFMVDFGLAKMHLGRDGIPLEQRQTADFRGTVTYASLNAHKKIVSQLREKIGLVQKGRSLELLLRGSGLLERAAAVEKLQGQQGGRGTRHQG